MIASIYIISAIALFFLSILDIKNREIPSILTWGFILFNLLYIGPQGLYGGAVMLIVGLLLMDFSEKYPLFEGGADLKVLVALGIILTQLSLLFFIPIFLMISLVYKATIRFAKPNSKDVPFIPAIFISLILLIIGEYYLAWF